MSPRPAQTSSDKGHHLPLPVKIDQNRPPQLLVAQKLPRARCVSTPAPGRSEIAPGQTRRQAPGAKPADSATPGDATRPATGSATTAPGGQKPSGDAATAPAGQKPSSDNAGSSTRNAGAASTPNTGASGGSASSTAASSSSASSSASVNLSTEQRTRVTQAFSSVNVQPLTNVNFSVSVGTVIRDDVRLYDLPPSIVEVVPQFWGYRYLVVRDEIVIVEPQTKRIVHVISRSGSAKRASLSISGEKRTAVKKALGSGSKVTRTIKVEEDMTVPQDIELSTVPRPSSRICPSFARIATSSMRIRLSS
jgi:hypothetical protein